MKHFIIEQSDDEFYTSYSGLALIGLCINRYSELFRMIYRKMDKLGNIISHADLLRNYLVLLSLKKSDYEAITSMRNDDYFKNSLGITNVSSAERLSQRLDAEADKYRQVEEKC